MIRSVRIHEFGGPQVLRIEDIEVEEPGEGEVRIRIRAIGINRTEITLRSGHSPAKPPLPTKIGFEAAGEVEAMGAGVKGFAARDRVALVPRLCGQPVWALW
jgi:NADPH:quinone reductase-like Zn-dependent oxidoreductase